MVSAHTQTNDAKRDATLVVAGCDAPKLFDTTKPSFDQITIALKVFVEGPLTLACRGRGHHGFKTALVQRLEKTGLRQKSACVNSPLTKLLAQMSTGSRVACRPCIPEKHH